MKEVNISAVRVFLMAMCVTLFSGFTSCEKTPENNAILKPVPFRVIGYFKGDLVKDMSRVDFSQLTHINIAFINPDSTGYFSTVPGLKEFVIKAHKNNVKVLISLGGGKAPAFLSQLITPEKRGDLIKGLIQLADSYNLDGIDVDLEGSLITDDYEGFIVALSQSLKEGKLLTAAVATEYGKSVSTGALAEFDFINIMSYDKTGPWRPSNPGQHAPYEMAEADILYWNTVKGVATEKLTLGLPFYGHSFNGNSATSLTYNRIVTDYPGAEYADEVKMKDGGTVYYNGISTIRKKTALALNATGGVMIWQLLQDANGEKSLLNLIGATVDTASKAQR